MTKWYCLEVDNGADNIAVHELEYSGDGTDDEAIDELDAYQNNWNNCFLVSASSVKKLITESIKRGVFDEREKMLLAKL